MEVDFFESISGPEKEAVRRDLERFGEEGIKGMALALSALRRGVGRSPMVQVWVEGGKEAYPLNMCSHLGKLRIVVDDYFEGEMVAVVTLDGLSCWTKGG